MRQALILATASLTMILAGCASETGSGYGTSGTAGSSASEEQNISPSEPGMGESMTRRSLPGTAGSSSSSW